jgi:hypothetical protein
MGGLTLIEYLQKGARRSLEEILDAMEEYEELSSVEVLSQ